jgi:hypothetical protein
MNLMRYSGNVLSALVKDGWTDLSTAVTTILFGRLRPEVVDELLEHLVVCDWVSIEKKICALRIGLRKLSGFRMKCASKLATFVNENLLPDGVNFLASLLLDDATRLSGLVILCSGAIGSLFGCVMVNDNIQHFPRILHFLNVALQRMEEAGCRPLEQFQLAVAKAVLHCLVRVVNLPRNQFVVMPACAVLRRIDEGLLRSVFEREDRALVVRALEPPRQKKVAEIQLRAFSDGRPARRSAATRGWQTLEIDSDD